MSSENEEEEMNKKRRIDFLNEDESPIELQKRKRKSNQKDTPLFDIEFTNISGRKLPGDMNENFLFLTNSSSLFLKNYAFNNRRDPYPVEIVMTHIFAKNFRKIFENNISTVFPQIYFIFYDQGCIVIPSGQKSICMVTEFKPQFFTSFYVIPEKKFIICMETSKLDNTFKVADKYEIISLIIKDDENPTSILIDMKKQHHDQWIHRQTIINGIEVEEKPKVIKDQDHNEMMEIDSSMFHEIIQDLASRGKHLYMSTYISDKFKGIVFENCKDSGQETLRLKISPMYNNNNQNDSSLTNIIGNEEEKKEDKKEFLCCQKFTSKFLALIARIKIQSKSIFIRARQNEPLFVSLPIYGTCTCETCKQGETIFQHQKVGSTRFILADCEIFPEELDSIHREHWEFLNSSDNGNVIVKNKFIEKIKKETK